jgi:hypothetical protein
MSKALPIEPHSRGTSILLVDDQHYAFPVGAEEFDTAFARLTQPYGAVPESPGGRDAAQVG